ncbi:MULTISPECIES: ComEC/Rec2 family competence protein [unclassified Myroides]|uniref:ComEC/Rec2 family competence protein n=1 Tax=unclassified Myroides TaxID=2642485 RepID=UPI003D2F9199
MRPLKFSFLFYATAVALGICSKSLCSVKGVVPVCIAFALLLFLSIKSKRIFHPFSFYFTGLLYYVLCFCLGFLTAFFVDWRQQHGNYTLAVVDQRAYQVDFRLVERQQTRSDKTRYIVAIEAVDQVFTQGKALVFLEDSVLKLGTKYQAVAHFKSFEGVKNSGQFDYAALMKRKGIEKQLLVQTMYPVDEGQYGYAWFMARRVELQQRIAQTKMSPQAKALLSALLLGDRQGIEQEQIDVFQRLGLMHVLAISGLHIGVIYLFLSVLTSFLNPRYRCVLLVFLLWIFVFLSGFSPSVFRAVFMFSLLSVAKEVRRKQPTREIIGLTLFFSLLFQPNWLFDVGFQLSYAAVLGIVWLMPLFKKAYTQNKYVNYYLGLCYVSLVAQLSVLPLQLYYFHSFSFSFLWSNVLVIPLLTLLLVLGMCFLCFGWMIPVVAESLAFCLEQITSFLFLLLDGLDQLNIQLTSIYISRVDLGLLLLGLVCMGYVLHHFNLKSIKIALVSLLLLPLISSGVRFIDQPSNAFIIASTREKEMLLLQYKNKVLSVFEYGGTTSIIVKRYQQHYQPSRLVQTRGKDVYQLDRSTKLVVLSRTTPFYQLKHKVEILYFHDNVQVNFDRVLAYHQPKQIVIGNQMGAGYKKRLKQSCRQKNIPFHDIRQKGYWGYQF